MKLSELLKILKKNGCFFCMHGSNHDIWESGFTGKRFAVPRHSQEDIPKGTVNSILKNAGLKK